MDSNYLRKWNAAYNERQKLQHVYVALAVLSFIVAAIASLIDQRSGRLILRVTLFVIAVFLANAVVWSLVHSNLLAGIKSRPPRS